VRSRRLPLLAVLCLIASFGPAAVARADTEPNNALVQAEGPISGGTSYSGSLATRDDKDWYVFYVQGQQQLHVSSTTSASDGDCGETRVADTDGKGDMPSDFTTPPGMTRYFVEVWNSETGCPNTVSYSFQIDPGSAVVTGPATQPAQETGEPNESGVQTAGPLQGGVPYSGSIDTSNDQDWFYFYTAPGQHQVDLAITGPALDGCQDVYVTLYPAEGDDEITFFGQSRDNVNHYRFTSEDAAMYRLRVVSRDKCTPAHWQLEVGPADSISTSPPPVHQTPEPPSGGGGGGGGGAGGGGGGPSHACIVARGRVKRDLKAQRTLRRQLSHAHSHRRRASLKRRLKIVRRDLHRAVGQRRLHCG
jgi:hypothetical protein